VVFVTLGVAIFNFGADAKKTSGNDSAYGLSLIAISLVMDAVTGGLQDRVKRTTKALNPRAGASAKPSVYESMLYTNLSGFVVALGFAFATGQLTSGVRSCVAHVALARAVLVYSLASAVGQVFIYYTITHFDVLVLTTVTTTRKIFSTVISVFRDPSNALNRIQWFGCSLVFTFLALDVVAAAFRPRHSAPAAATAARRAPSSRRAERDTDTDRAAAAIGSARSTSSRRRHSSRRSSS
jgi:UDP-galactose transporter B1